jgi:hypothetical protein
MRRHLKLFSDPLILRWDGWEGRTDHLQYMGWQLSAEQNVRRATMQIAAYHPHTGMSLMTEMQDFRYYSAEEYYVRGIAPLPALQVKALGRVELVLYGAPQIQLFDRFDPIDAKPHACEVTRSRMEDFFHFAPAASPNDLIVPDTAIPELLDRILKLQQPACEQRAKARVAARLLTL